QRRGVRDAFLGHVARRCEEVAAGRCPRGDPGRRDERRHEGGGRDRDVAPALASFAERPDRARREHEREAEGVRAVQLRPHEQQRDRKEESAVAVAQQAHEDGEADQAQQLRPVRPREARERERGKGGEDGDERRPRTRRQHRIDDERDEHRHGRGPASGGSGRSSTVVTPRRERTSRHDGASRTAASQSANTSGTNGSSRPSMKTGRDGARQMRKPPQSYSLRSVPWPCETSATAPAGYARSSGACGAAKTLRATTAATPSATPASAPRGARGSRAEGSVTARGRPAARNGTAANAK